MSSISLYNIQSETPVMLAELDLKEKKLNYLHPYYIEILRTKAITIPALEQLGGDFKGKKEISLNGHKIDDPLSAKAFVKIFWQYSLHHDIYVWKDEKGQKIINPVSFL